jgi:hypothetical protein
MDPIALKGYSPCMAMTKYSHKLPNNRENTNGCFLGSLYKHNIHEGAVAMSCAP